MNAWRWRIELGRGAARMTEIAPRPGAKPLTSQNVLFAQIVVGVFLLVKIYIVFNAPPVGDEAYYWMWSQKLGLSYFDHPPLHAWLLRAMAALFAGTFLRCAP